MAGKVDSFEDALNNHVFGVATYTPTASGWWAALSTTVITGDAAAGWTEVVGSSYTRIRLQPSHSAGSSNGVISNNLAQIQWPSATGSPYDVKAFAIYDAGPTGGTIRYAQNLGATITVGVGQQFVIPQSALTLSEE